MEIKIPFGRISMETNHKEHGNLSFRIVPGRFQVNTQRKKWKNLTQWIQIRSDSIKVYKVYNKGLLLSTTLDE